ncbi:hypothetical protein JW707_04275 [Candidatus Woesearchaeota archaeon]|nr:hypothetical protein [Candidatus Woesearchaeota archaeon]
MDRKKVYNTSNVLLFLVGIFFILSSKATMTGAVVGVSETYTELRLIVGLFLLLNALLMFIYSKNR